MSLFEAVAAGDVARVEELLAGGTHPDPFDTEDCTPLMRAAEEGREDLVQALMAAGADPTLVDRLGESAFIKAAARGQADICTLLQQYAREDEKDLARTLLQAAGWTDGMPPRPPPAEPTKQDAWRRKLATAGAWFSERLSEGDTARRMERAERAEKKGRGK